MCEYGLDDTAPNPPAAGELVVFGLYGDPSEGMCVWVEEHRRRADGRPMPGP